MASETRSLHSSRSCRGNVYFSCCYCSAVCSFGVQSQGKTSAWCTKAGQTRDSCRPAADINPSQPRSNAHALCRLVNQPIININHLFASLCIITCVVFFPPLLGIPPSRSRSDAQGKVGTAPFHEDGNTPRTFRESSERASSLLRQRFVHIRPRGDSVRIARGARRRNQEEIHSSRRGRTSIWLAANGVRRPDEQLRDSRSILPQEGRAVCVTARKSRPGAALRSRPVREGGRNELLALFSPRFRTAPGDLDKSVVSSYVIAPIFLCFPRRAGLISIRLNGPTPPRHGRGANRKRAGPIISIAVRP